MLLFVGFARFLFLPWKMRNGVDVYQTCFTQADTYCTVCTTFYNYSSMHACAHTCSTCMCMSCVRVFLIVCSRSLQLACLTEDSPGLVMATRLLSYRHVRCRNKHTWGIQLSTETKNIRRRRVSPLLNNYLQYHTTWSTRITLHTVTSPYGDHMRTDLSRSWNYLAMWLAELESSRVSKCRWLLHHPRRSRWRWLSWRRSRATFRSDLGMAFQDFTQAADLGEYTIMAGSTASSLQ